MTKTVNGYSAYALDNWPRNPLNNFTLKNCLFGATNIVKNNGKSKYVYSGYGIAFDGAFRGVLLMILLGTLQFLVLIIVHLLILIIARIIF